MLAISRRLFPVLNTRAFSLAPDNSTASTLERTISKKLTDEFDPSQLKVQDTSGGCGTFYAIVIASEKFQGLPVLQQHRLVKDTLKAEIEGIHGVQIKTISH